MTFENPEAFFLLLLIPLYWVLQRRRRRSLSQFSSVQLLAEWPITFRQRMLKLRPCVRCVVIFLIVVGLARPREIIDTHYESDEGIAIEFVIDRSSSMAETLLFDGVKRQRLEVVKSVLQRFILGDGDQLKGRPHDLLGIVSFARYGDTICPLARNVKAVASLVESLQLASARAEDGTAIGDALLLASSRLHQAEVELQKQRETNAGDVLELKSKVIILLTDGSNNAGNKSPEDAAQQAKEWGIKIYAIGLANGRQSVWGPNIDEDLLASLSQSTGGAYFSVSNATQLEQVYKTIDQLETSTVESPEYIKGQETFQIWVLLAALLMIVDQCLAASWLRTNP
ncbi:MAG: VWA domain-containing protein [Planctomycetota bacterium]|nr:VWA domain-containing protein [Planctomycetota bacterium]